MDLSFLDESSQMTPLLVKMYDSQRLHGLAQDKKPLARAELSGAVCELLEMELSPQESELLADVMIELMRQAEIDLRQALAEKLSIMENVPLRLTLQMANDDISVAGSILSKSVVLSDLDLIYIIKSKGADHWRAIASRPQMSDQIMNILVDTNEEGTVETLIKNTNIKLTEYALDVTTQLACESERLAKPLLQRPEVTPDIAKRLYHHVGDALKAYIKDEYGDSVGGSIVDLVDDVIVEFSDAAEEEHLTDGEGPGQNALKDADRYKEKGLLTTKLMLGTLRRGQFDAFTAQFSRFTGMSPKTVKDILEQPSGQGLAVACRAFDINKADFVSIFLLTNKLRDADKMADLKVMDKAINYFERIKEDVAKDIIQNSLEEKLKD